MQDLTKGKTFKVLFRFAIPLLLANLLSASYNMADLLIAGKLLGSNALSATGSTTVFIQFLSSLFWGFGVATSARVGALFGEGDKPRIITTVKTVLLTVAAVMLTLTLACVLLAPEIMVWLKVDTEIRADAQIYFQIYMAGLFLQALAYQMASTFESLGDSKFPLLMTAISGFGNIGLNILFVLVFKLGVAGLAYATVISSFISLLMGFIKMVVVFRKLDGSMSFSFSWAEFKNVGRLAIPCILQQCSLYLASVVVQPMVNGLGKAVSAGYAVAMNINLLFNALYHGIARAVAAYSSQSKGSLQEKNYSKGIYIGLIQQAILVVPLFVLFEIIPGPIVSIFLKGGDESCLPYATQFMTVCLPFVFFAAYGNLMHSFFKAVEGGKSVLLSTLCFMAARIALAYLIPNIEYLFSVYLSLGLAWVFEAIVIALLYYTGWWKKIDKVSSSQPSKVV